MLGVSEPGLKHLLEAKSLNRIVECVPLRISTEDTLYVNYRLARTDRKEILFEITELNPTTAEQFMLNPERQTLIGLGERTRDIMHAAKGPLIALRTILDGWGDSPPLEKVTRDWPLCAEWPPEFLPSWTMS